MNKILVFVAFSPEMSTVSAMNIRENIKIGNLSYSKAYSVALTREAWSELIKTDGLKKVECTDFTYFKFDTDERLIEFSGIDYLNSNDVMDGVIHLKAESFRFID